MEDYSAAITIWDSVYVRITDVRHGYLIREKAVEKDENSMFLFASGKDGLVWVEDTPYVIRTNGLFHVGRNRRIEIDSPDGEMEYFLFTYHPDPQMSARREMVRLMAQENPFDSCLGVRPSNAAYFFSQFREMADAWHEKLPQSRMIMKRILYAVVGGFFAELMRADMGAVRVNYFEKAKRYLEENFAQTNSIQMLADVMGISRTTLHESFRRCMGMSPQQYLMKLRLEAARDALRNSSLTIQEIAVSCGLRDKNYLSRVYKKRYGVAPGAARREWADQCEGEKQHCKEPEEHAEKQRKGYPMRQAAAPGYSDRQIFIENFGRIHHYDKVPQRVVCLDYSAAELCAALGAAKRIAGVAAIEYSLLDCDEAYRGIISEAEHLPAMSNTSSVPDFAAVCAGRPQLAIGTAYSFNRCGGCAEAEEFERRGIHVYAARATCAAGGTFEDTYQDIRNIGQILNLEVQAGQLIEKMRVRERLLGQKVSEKPALRVFVLDSLMEGRVMTCGQSLESYLIRAAGGVNVFEQRNRQFILVEWEEVAAADPEVILIHRFYDGDDGKRKKAFLKENPYIAQTKAMQNGRIYVIGVKKVFPGIDNVETAFQMAEWFAECRSDKTTS